MGGGSGIGLGLVKRFIKKIISLLFVDSEKTLKEVADHIDPNGRLCSAYVNDCMNAIFRKPIE